MKLTMTRPDDWHLHVRDGDSLKSVIAHSARQFGRAIMMPNLKLPVINTALATAYRDRILAAL
ncbi:MAG: dihydroorotase, partial [Gammaproteobacteria bacterium]